MRRFPRTFLWTFLTALYLISPISDGETLHLNLTQTGNTTSHSLEIHISPLRWENSCLLVALDLINQSNVPVLLTVMGPYFDVALDVSKDDSSSQDALEWVNVSGASDIVSWDAEPLAPNSPSHKNYCIGEKVWVTNRKKVASMNASVLETLGLWSRHFSCFGEGIETIRSWTSGVLSPGQSATVHVAASISSYRFCRLSGPWLLVLRPRRYRMSKVA